MVARTRLCRRRRRPAHAAGRDLRDADRRRDVDLEPLRGPQDRLGPRCHRHLLHHRVRRLLGARADRARLAGPPLHDPRKLHDVERRERGRLHVERGPRLGDAGPLSHHRPPADVARARTLAGGRLAARRVHGDPAQAATRQHRPSPLPVGYRHGRDAPQPPHRRRRSRGQGPGALHRGRGRRGARGLAGSAAHHQAAGRLCVPQPPSLPAHGVRPRHPDAVHDRDRGVADHGGGRGDHGPAGGGLDAPGP